jgi:hypothetical protein
MRSCEDLITIRPNTGRLALDSFYRSVADFDRSGTCMWFSSFFSGKISQNYLEKELFKGLNFPESRFRCSEIFRTIL